MPKPPVTGKENLIKKFNEFEFYGEKPSFKGLISGLSIYFTDEFKNKIEKAKEWINSDKKIAIDVGFRRGYFIRTFAWNFPFYNIIGLEVDGKWIARLEKHPLPPNILLVKSDVRIFLPLVIPNQRISLIVFNFPDPWWKDKHKERKRLFDFPLINEIKRVLAIGGIVHISTDVETFYKYIKNNFLSESGFKLLHKNESPIANYYSHRRWHTAKEGRQIFDLVFKKL